MRNYSFCKKISIVFVIIFFSLHTLKAQKSSEDILLGAADLYKAKKSALEYLNDSLIVKKYGVISDAIWNYAELGYAGI